MIKRFTIVRLVILAAALLTLPLGAALADFDSGQAAFKEHRYQDALAAWRPLATNGDSEAQYRVGFLYSRGLGVKMDHAEASRWYLMAARQGHAKAQGRLGTFLMQGKGTTKDLIEAYKWLSLAAEQEAGTFRPLRDVLKREMSDEEIAEAEARLAAWHTAHD